MEPNTLRILLTVFAHVVVISVQGVQSATTPAPRQLRVVTVLSEPYAYYGTDGNRSVLQGFIPDLLREFSAELGVNYQLYIVPDGGYGTLTSNGSWNGMIGEVVRGQADMAAADMTISSPRLQAVDFLHPIQNYGLSLLVRKTLLDTDMKEAQQAAIHFGILAPFSVGVWILLACMYVVVSVSLWLLNRFNPREWGGQTDLPGSEQHLTHAFSLTGAFWFTITTLQWQGYERSPRSLAGRLVACCWLMYVTLTLTGYTAGLVTQLWAASELRASDPDTAPLHDLAHLVASARYNYGVVAGGSSYFYITHTGADNKDEYAAMTSYWSTELGRKQLVANYSAGVTRVRQENYVLVMETMMARWVANQAPCDLVVVDDFAQRSFGFAITKNSPYRAEMNQALLRMKESGVVEALERRHWEGRGACWRGEQVTRAAKDHVLARRAAPAPITVSLFWGPLVVMAAGLVLGALVTVGEVIYHMKYEKKEGELMASAANF